VSQQAKGGGVEYVLRGTDSAATLVSGGVQIVESASQTWLFASIWRKQEQSEDPMPTFIKMLIKLEEPAWFLSNDFRAVVLFSGIGLVLTLIAVSKGVQGVWL
jgi:hypothetical protein